MTQSNDILKRLIEATGTDSAAAFARMLEINPKGVYAAVKRDQIPPGWLIQVAEKFNVSMDWLYFGTGPKFLSPPLLDHQSQNDAQIVSKRIRQLREKLDLTPGKLAGLVGVSPNQIQYWEEGDMLPPSDKIIALARALGCGVDWLYGLENNAREFDITTCDSQTPNSNGQAPTPDNEPDTESLKFYNLMLEFLKDMKDTGQLNQFRDIFLKRFPEFARWLVSRTPNND